MNDHELAFGILPIVCKAWLRVEDFDTMRLMQSITTKLSCIVKHLMLCMALVALATPIAIGGVLGDRLVIAVNSVPYTQRQLELYFTIKLNARADHMRDEVIVSAANWNEALSVYTNDMMILQEAMRLGSFAAPEQLVDQYNAVLRRKITRGSQLQSVLSRLGADDSDVSHTLDSVLRVASFQQNRNRQEQQANTGKKSGADKGPESVPKWLEELRARTNSRVFAGAETYVEIRPTAGGGRGN